MIEVYLDNQRLEIPEDTSIGLSVGIANIEDPISASASYSQTIKVPNTPHNSKVFRHAEQLLLAEVFNHSEHTAAIYEDGVELIKGKAYLDGATDKDYSIQIVGNEFGWLERIRDKKLNEIDDEQCSYFREYMQVWAQNEGIFFGLVDHGCWWQNVGENVVRRKWATYADLVPFVRVDKILKTIFKGYDVQGTPEWLLARLYITGQWLKPDNAEWLQQENSFKLTCAGNNIVATTLDGEPTYVVGDRLSSTNISWVNVFDTLDSPSTHIIMETEDVDIDGEPITHYIPYFEPSEDITTAFKVRIKYTTSLSYLANKQKYAFADTLYLRDNKTPIARLSLDDGIKAVDSAEALNKGLFRSVAITAKPANLNVLYSEKSNFYIRLSDSSMYTEVVQITWQVYPTQVYTKYTTIAPITSNEVHFRAACNYDLNTNYTSDTSVRAAIGLKTKYGNIVVIGDAEQAYEVLDFALKYKVIKYECTNADEVRLVNVALYNLTDVGSATFEVSAITAGVPIESIGSGLTIGFKSSNGIGSTDIVVNVEEAEIEPVFNFAKSWNDPISFNDVAGDVLATDALKDIMTLFNLRIYVNEEQKRVYIVPYIDFYDDGVVDWRDRVDLDKGVEVSYIGSKIGKTFSLRYAEDNPIIADYNKTHKEPYLSFKRELADTTSDADYEVVCSLNAPIQTSARRIFPESAPDYQILQLAKDSEQNTLDALDINSLPRTLVLLEEGSDDDLLYYANGGYISDYVQPKFVIENTNNDDSISFGDTPNVDGLNKYYYPQLNAWDSGKRITCYCKLYPQEVASLRKPGTSVVDFRSRFLLKINGEDIYCRLESIENYEPLNATHKCTFVYLQ